MLTHYGSALPSFDALPLSIQRAVRFTQSKIAFNHGWLVQAEAPPKALFGQFKAVIKSGGAADCDIAFYFVHWLTDLAGAIPSPLEGSEKFVLKFPHPVLGSSRYTTFGSAISEHATESRRFIPPEYDPARLWHTLVSFTAATRASRSEAVLWTPLSAP